MESVTALLWGPLSFLLVYMICADHPLRHAIQLVVSLGQIYGDVLYYATSLFEHYQNSVHFCRPEGYYFWFYYAFFNAIWIIVPTRESGVNVYKSARANFASVDATQHLGHRSRI
jgi:cholestenol Delta-isomerase